MGTPRKKSERNMVAVGKPVTQHPPHGSVREKLSHTALTSGQMRTRTKDKTLMGANGCPNGCQALKLDFVLCKWQGGKHGPADTNILELYESGTSIKGTDPFLVGILVRLPVNSRLWFSPTQQQDRGPKTETHTSHSRLGRLLHLEGNVFQELPVSVLDLNLPVALHPIDILVRIGSPSGTHL